MCSTPLHMELIPPPSYLEVTPLVHVEAAPQLMVHTVYVQFRILMSSWQFSQLYYIMVYVMLFIMFLMTLMFIWRSVFLSPQCLSVSVIWSSLTFSSLGLSLDFPCDCRVSVHGAFHTWTTMPSVLPSSSYHLWLPYHVWPQFTILYIWSSHFPWPSVYYIIYIVTTLPWPSVHYTIYDHHITYDTQSTILYIWSPYYLCHSFHQTVYDPYTTYDTQFTIPYVTPSSPCHSYHPKISLPSLLFCIPDQT